MRIDPNEMKEGLPVLIGFIDLNEDKCYPLRFASLLKYHFDAGRGYFEVKLENYTATTLTPEVFQEYLTSIHKDMATKDRPHGLLAFCGEPIPNYENYLTKDDVDNSIWVAKVNSIINCERLRDDAVFTKFTLKDKKGRVLLPEPGTTKYQVRKNSEYIMYINYICHSCDLSCTVSQSEKVHDRERKWGNERGISEHAIFVDDKSQIDISLKIKKQDKTDINNCVNATIQIEPKKDNKKLILATKLLLIVFFAASIFLSTYIGAYSAIPQDAAPCLRWILTDNIKSIVLGLCAVIDGLALWFFERLAK